ncbi:S1 family peptidase [Burkholderia vietnamiensis]|uniref:S1 family peptidase n=1 Tax=Burkholderia vietnamiensis TaxID=60552 RepID=UPI0009BD5F60|nr:serine protease [Burkholderia vietnamiensis]
MTDKNERYTILQSLSADLQEKIAVDLLIFFNPLNYKHFCKLLGLPETENIQPLSLGQFYEWARSQPSQNPSYDRLRQHISSMVKKMSHAGLLSHEGKGRSGVLGDGDHYYAGHERSIGASKGTLFLGQALGASYIAHKFQRSLVPVVGKTKDGHPAVGTGVHVHPEYLVTCRHVIDDMRVSDKLTVHDVEVEVIDCLTDSSTAVDVGVVKISQAVPLALPDLMFRDAHVLEDILVAGFPTVPTALDRFASFQRGEICQTSVPTYWKYDVDLFSAIARPGNSGGPLISLEGNVIGIVTQSLERETETNDKLKTLPFFAAVPASDVRLIFEKLTGQSLPWEDYQ